MIKTPICSLVAPLVKNPPAMQETWVWSLSWEEPLEKGMATHSSILAWRILWTEEPGGLQSMGSQKVGHDWVTNFYMFSRKFFFFKVLWSAGSSEPWSPDQRSVLPESKGNTGCVTWILLKSLEFRTKACWELSHGNKQRDGTSLHGSSWIFQRLGSFLLPWIPCDSLISF